MPAPEFESLFVMNAEVSMPPQLVGAVPAGYTRRIMNVIGGEFEGKKVRGRILPGGSDAVRVRADGAAVLDVRMVLETDYAELIFATYTGIRTGPPAVLEKLKQGIPLARGEDYFRTAIFFETASSRIAWLNDIVAIGYGCIPSGAVARDHLNVVYEVLELK